MCSCSVAPEDAHGPHPRVASHVRPCLRHDALQDLATIRVTEILVPCYLAIMIANDVAEFVVEDKHDQSQKKCSGNKTKGDTWGRDTTKGSIVEEDA